jgi:hypothetical protein
MPRHQVNEFQSAKHSAYFHVVLGSKKEAPVTWGFFFFLNTSPAHRENAA